MTRMYHVRSQHGGATKKPPQWHATPVPLCHRRRLALRSLGGLCNGGRQQQSPPLPTTIWLQYQVSCGRKLVCRPWILIESTFRRSSPERGSSLLPRPTSDQWLQIAALARTNSRYPAPSVGKYQKHAAGGWCHWRAAEACRRPGKPHPSIPSWRSSAASPSSLPGTLEVKAGGKTFPHTLLVPSTCPRPRPPPSPSSPVAGARVARPRSPPEAQGVRETRPEAPLFCRLRPPLLPNQPQPRGE